jgi:hypothetical protein
VSAGRPVQVGRVRRSRSRMVHNATWTIRGTAVMRACLGGAVVDTRTRCRPCQKWLTLALVRLAHLMPNRSRRRPVWAATHSRHPHRRPRHRRRSRCGGPRTRRGPLSPEPLPTDRGQGGQDFRQLLQSESRCLLLQRAALDPSIFEREGVGAGSVDGARSLPPFPRYTPMRCRGIAHSVANDIVSPRAQIEGA